MANLCVNVDHVATLRQARGGSEPDPVHAALEAELAGSTGVTVHLREDCRHIQERDVRLIRQLARGHLNLEMAATDAMVRFALEVKPDIATLVPERREELTTEGGLNVIGGGKKLKEAISRLRSAGITVSLFVDADPAQIRASKSAGADEIELHTGPYCNARQRADIGREFKLLLNGAKRALDAGLVLNAGHGLNYTNVLPVAQIEGMRELNIGHSIISRAVFDGMRKAVSDMVSLIAPTEA
ncbi:pyridoxine 5'-phosphate synthase [Candidatus Sumerlaeota bacterium]|nr:pyridoxine 5'-phosphate synthase [Candidatus Sumerlaeota bacterium]